MNDRRDNRRGKIAVVGASARAAAHSIRRAGYSPVAADLFADADLQENCPVAQITNYPDGFCGWLAEQDVGGWIYTGALENYPDVVDQLTTFAPLWGNPGNVLKQVRNPLRLQQVLREADLNFPETRIIPTDQGKWLAKTYQGSSGSGVQSWEPSTETASFANLLLATSSNPPPLSAGEALEKGASGFKDKYYQQSIGGIPIAAMFVASAERTSLLGVTKQLINVAWTHAKSFQYAGSIGPWNVSSQATESIMRTGEVLTKEFGLAGLFGVDMILDGDHIWTLEVNPRYTAAVEVVERMTGKLAMPLHIKAYFPQLPTQARATSDGTSRCAGKAVLFAQQAVNVTTSFSEWALEQSQLKPWPTIGDVPLPGTNIEPGHPVLTVFTDGESANDVEVRLHQRCIEAETKLYHR